MKTQKKTVKEYSTEEKIKQANEAIIQENNKKMAEFHEGYKVLVEKTGFCLNPVITLKQGSVTASFEITAAKK